MLCHWAWLKKDTYWFVNNREAKETALQAIFSMVEKLKELWHAPQKMDRIFQDSWAISCSPQHIPPGQPNEYPPGPPGGQPHLPQQRSCPTTQWWGGSINCQLATTCLAEHLVIQKAHASSYAFWRVLGQSSQWKGHNLLTQLGTVSEYPSVDDEDKWLYVHDWAVWADKFPETE